MTDADVDGAHIRDAAAHLLLPADAGADRARPPLHSPAAALQVTRGKSSQYLKDQAAFEDYLIDTGLEESSLTLGSGEVRAGQDRRGRWRMRWPCASSHGLHTRYNRPGVEQAAIAAG